MTDQPRRALTDTERQILNAACDGLNAREIGELLHADTPSTRTAISRICYALRARGLQHAVQIYRTQQQP